MVLVILIFVLFFTLAILQFIFPGQAFAFGKRWQFEGEIELSKSAIFLIRLSSIIGILFLIFITYMFLTFKPF